MKMHNICFSFDCVNVIQQKINRNCAKKSTYNKVDCEIDDDEDDDGQFVVRVNSLL